MDERSTADATASAGGGSSLHFLALIAAIAVLSPASSALHAQDQNAPRYTIKQDQADTGSNIKRDLVSGSAIPLNKRYSELTPEQQAVVKAQYQHMGPNDEPPFPLNGLGPIYEAIATAQQKLLVTGDLTLAVDIDSQGDATSVSVLRSPDPEMVKFAAAVLMNQKYKPASCAGVPCKMQYPFRITFQTR